MLTVYSTQGSPGASTTAMHLAANWASASREVLLVELDPAGGSLSHNLGIQFTPGSASFVASGLPVLSNHLIDHAQDVLFENLHVMPAPGSPTGARGIFNTFADFAGDLRAISENEMAVVVDGGRITADTAASALTTEAAGVVVVCGNNSQLSSLEHLKGVLDADGGGEGPAGCVVTVGQSPMDPDEWLETCGLTFCGSIEFVSDMATDLSAYMARSKRKSKKWRASLEQVGEKLYPYAQPPLSAPHRKRSAAPEAPSGTDDAETAEGTDVAAPALVPPPTQDPAYSGQPPTAPSEPPPDFAPPMAPAPGYGQSHYLPPTVGPEGYGQAPPPMSPEDYPGYGQPVPPPYVPPEYPTPYEQPHLPPEYPTPYEQPHLPPQHPAHLYEQPYVSPQHPTHFYEQPYVPPQHPASPYEQPQHPAHPYEQPQAPAHPYEQPPYPASPYEQPPSSAPSFEQPAPHSQHPTHRDQPAAPDEQSQPVGGEQPDLAATQPVAAQPESSSQPSIQPTGSFRDWALKLHGSDAEDMTAGRGG